MLTLWNQVIYFQLYWPVSDDSEPLLGQHDHFDTRQMNRFGRKKKRNKRAAQIEIDFRFDCIDPN